MNVPGIGKLADLGSCWRLVYDQCNHVQVFAQAGLNNAEGAALYVRRYYATCLTCPLSESPVAAETSNPELRQVRLVLSTDELRAIVCALRTAGLTELADRLELSHVTVSL
jgi:hypothetical protein